MGQALARERFPNRPQPVWSLGMPGASVVFQMTLVGEIPHDLPAIDGLRTIPFTYRITDNRSRAWFAFLLPKTIVLKGFLPGKQQEFPGNLRNSVRFFKWLYCCCWCCCWR
jgi:hypothetical protein